MEATSAITLKTYQPLEQWTNIRSDLIQILDTDKAIKQEFLIYPNQNWDEMSRLVIVILFTINPYIRHHMIYGSQSNAFYAL